MWGKTVYTSPLKIQEKTLSIFHKKRQRELVSWRVVRD